jgi:hypothetical protein
VLVLMENIILVLKSLIANAKVFAVLPPQEEQG